MVNLRAFPWQSSEEAIRVAAKRLKAIREARGMKQATLAKRAHLHPNTVSRFESEPHRAQFSTFVAACMGLGCDPRQILSLKKPTPHKVNRTDTPSLRP